VQADHFDMNDFTDVDIDLSYSMPLAMAHDTGIKLSDELKIMNNIERAFTHLYFKFKNQNVYLTSSSVDQQ